jgi:quercetin dioxygenase-like cupin family protein
LHVTVFNESEIPEMNAEMNPMQGKFVIAKKTEAKAEDFGTLSWLSNPPNTGARQLTVIDVKLDPGKGHNFHKHPDQEEVILVAAGKVEQWIDREKRILGPGDCAFIPADVVHASFNIGDQPVKIVAILGPCVGPIGYELVDVANDAPWSTLRK